MHRSALYTDQCWQPKLYTKALFSRKLSNARSFQKLNTAVFSFQNDGAFQVQKISVFVLEHLSKVAFEPRHPFKLRKCRVSLQRVLFVGIPGINRLWCQLEAEPFTSNTVFNIDQISFYEIEARLFFEIGFCILCWDVDRFALYVENMHTIISKKRYFYLCGIESFCFMCISCIWKRFALVDTRVSFSLYYVRSFIRRGFRE